MTCFQSFSMIFFLLDLIFWQTWGLLTWCVQYLGPLILLVQLVRLVRADADLTLLMCEKFGMMPGERKPRGCGLFVPVERQNGLTTSHLHTQLDPVAYKLMICG